LFVQKGIFLSNYFALVIEFFENFFDKIFQFDMLNYFAKSSSLNSYRLSPNPQAFSSGEGGPRGAVNEEETQISNKIKKVILHK